jgi:hypothetical protein
VIASVEEVDAVRARDILKGHTCVLTRGPFSLEKAAPHEVVDFYKGAFDRYGKDGGLIFNIRLPDEVGMAEVKPMIAKIREYCRY